MRSQDGELPEVVGSLPEIVALMASDPRFAGFSVLRRTDEMVELAEGASGAALLALPSIWRSRERRQDELARCAQRDTLLVCIGRGDGDMRRLVALVASSRISCLSLPQSPTSLLAALTNQMSLYRAQQRAQQRGEAAERYRYELSELIAIGASLNSERDISRLLGMILSKARFVTGADAGSVYIVKSAPTDQGTDAPQPARGEGESEPARRVLRFEVAQNDSVPVDFKSFVLDISATSIVGAAVLGAESINIPDLYHLDEHNPWGVVHNRSFDERTGYRTHSALTVPMINAKDVVIGVIQLINKKTASGPMRTPEDFASRVVPFDKRGEDLCKTLAYQAAIALDNALLHDELRRVFEGFVEASVLAIEARDPSTSGHSRRVADLTVGLAKAAERSREGAYRDLHFGTDDLKEIEYAGLLHDFGKVGVPEHVLVKANKLHPAELDLVHARFDYIDSWLRVQRLEVELAAVRGVLPVAEVEGRLAALDAELTFLPICLETIKLANRPTVLDSEQQDLLDEIANHRYRTAGGDERPYLTAHELGSLRVRRGSLNDEERRQIESHVVHTYNFLCTIPWGRTLSRIPRIAGDHHEKLDGTGYPRRRRSEAIPVQAKMMAVADIFDALTASDRPYKRALPLARALSILEDEVRQGKLEPALFEIFVGAEVYRLVLKEQSLG